MQKMKKITIVKIQKTKMLKKTIKMMDISSYRAGCIFGVGVGGIGLTEQEYSHFRDGGVSKISARYVPMMIANMAGIKIFATGGIGGVHRGAETTMDISADLDELQQTSVMVVCAGAKSILDIGLTLECLETRGVPVIGYRTNDMPAFYTQKSGFRVDYRLDSPEEIAKAYAIKKAIGMQGGMLVVNPIPDAYAMDSDYINENINRAVAEAEHLGIHGKETTPYLLDKIQKLTGGRSLEANIQLVYNNARLASEIAKALH